MFSFIYLSKALAVAKWQGLPSKHSHSILSRSPCDVTSLLAIISIHLTACSDAQLSSFSCCHPPFAAGPRPRP